MLEVCNRLNNRSSGQYEQQTPTQRFEQERADLLSNPPKWDAARVTYNRVDKYATVIIDQNRYSVPDHLVGQKVMVKVYAERICCFHVDERVAEHERLCGQHRWRLELDHVLSTLRRKKPSALAGSMALQQVDKKFETYLYWKGERFHSVVAISKRGDSL